MITHGLDVEEFYQLIFFVGHSHKQLIWVRAVSLSLTGFEQLTCDCRNEVTEVVSDARIIEESLPKKRNQSFIQLLQSKDGFCCRPGHDFSNTEVARQTYLLNCWTSRVVRPPARLKDCVLRIIYLQHCFGRAELHSDLPAATWIILKTNSI